MLKKCIVLLACLFAATGGSAWQTTGITGEGIRADGMGGAGVASGENYEAIFYNPAGLAKMNSGCLVVPSFYMKANQDIITLLSAMSNMSSDAPPSQEALLNLANRAGVLKGILLAGVVKPSWALNFYAIDDLLSTTWMDDSVTFHMLTDNKTDAGLIFSLAGRLPKLIPFLDLSVGGNVRYIYRMQRQYDMVNNNEWMIEFDPQQGWGLDAGAICRVLDLVDVGVMFKDIYAKVGADSVPMNMTLGASAKLLGFITVAVDLDNLTDLSSGDLLDKLKLGAEVSLFNFLKIRGGMSNKYPTAGLGISLFFFKFDYAFTGEKPGGVTAPIGTHAINCAIIL